MIGGRTVRGGNLSAHERYDADADRWVALAPLPRAQGGLAAATLHGSSWALGGEWTEQGGGGVFGIVWRYDAARDGWDRAGTLPEPRHGLGAVALGGRIRVVGGATQPGAAGTSPRVDVFLPRDGGGRS